MALYKYLIDIDIDIDYMDYIERLTGMKINELVV